MTSQITFLGDLSGGLTGHHLAHYTPLGLEWSAEELRRVRLTRSDPECDGDFCSYCQQLNEYQQDGTVPHQPGYRALSASASKCSLCFFLLPSLDQRIPNWIKHEKWTKQDQMPSLQQVMDRITVYSIPRSPTIGPSLGRFIVTWSGEGFHWTGDIIGIHDHIRKESPSRAIWTGNDGTNFDARFPVINDWLSQCLTCHPTCAQMNESTLPTRVLDIGLDRKTSYIRLIDGQAMSARYAALSHCWGTAKPLTTTIETLASRMQKIGVCELPKTFRDTIEILWRLKFRYLWIDTLCIIQNDNADWTRESASMSRIFGNAFICIAASAARDCDSGLIVPFVASVHDSESTHALRISSIHLRQAGLPLEERAWTLQEDLLAHRVIYSAHGQVLWRCKSFAASEDGLLDGLAHEEPVYAKIRNIVSKLTLDNRRDYYNVWKRLVEIYSRREITFSTDKVAAMAGIAEHFRNLLLDEPVLGMWRQTIVDGMLWRAAAGATRSPVPQIPSWSWLSVTGSIDYGQLWIKLADRDDYFIDPTLFICSINISWSSVPFTSTLTDANIIARGFLLQASIRVEDSIYPQTVQLSPTTAGADTTLGTGHVDIVPVGILNDSVICLHVANITSHDILRNTSRHGTYVVLLLQPVPGVANTYVRVGLALLDTITEDGAVNVVPFTKAFPTSEEATITII